MGQRALSRQRALFAFLLFDAAQNLLFMRLSGSSALYASGLKILPPVGWAIQCWMVVEIFGHWTERYPGIGKFGRRLLAAFSVLAVFIGIAVGWRSYPMLEWAESLRGAYVLRVAATFALTLFMILTTWFFRRFFCPAAPRNLIRHTWISLFGFLALSARATLFNGRLIPIAVLQYGMLAIWIGCYSCWLMMLSPEGDAVTVPARDAEQEAAIAAIDAELTEEFRRLEVGQILRGLWKR
jgi:hypothetical protein